MSWGPTNPPKRGSGFDLVIAILAAADVIPLSALVNVVFFAELDLDGSLRPVPGVLPAILVSAAGGIDTAVVPAANGDEAQLAPGIRMVAADSLAPRRPAPVRASRTHWPARSYP